ncbi:MAG TPA: zinc ABC transporter substrate-binding protein [Solirubrobacterales bacterium]|nr:zinc ABC transporter substrate-binding protein [Solirubrobacterales bacterium]
MPLPRPRQIVTALALIAALALAIGVAGCGGGSSSSFSSSTTSEESSASGSGEKIGVVGAENEYANVAEQIGGEHVEVSAIESDPNTDPHTFEASASVANEVSGADVLIENGVGYDSYMEKIESASPSDSRKVINVQELLGLPDSTPNPHLWYKPETMPAVAKQLVTDFSELQPENKSYFEANLKKFEASLEPWMKGLEEFTTKYPGAAVATTEPVADYMLEAAGIENLTPFSMQADIMNDTDPAPQAVSMQESFFKEKKADAFVYNQQVTDSITEKFLESAHDNDVPVVGVYETMPTEFTYQEWMMAELKALEEALQSGKSTEEL